MYINETGRREMERNNMEMGNADNNDDGEKN